MRTQPVHHAIGVGIGITPSKTDQMNALSFEGLRDFSRDMMGALHQVRDDHAITNALPTVRTNITFKFGSAI
jgi:hypothetical protein